MRRGIDDKTILEKFVEEFCAIVEKHVCYIICSGFVAIAHGRSRGTEDIDMIIERIGFWDFSSLHSDLIKNGFECMQSGEAKEIYYTYLDRGDSVRYTRKGEFLPEMEVKFAKDSLDEEQLDSRMKLPFTGMDVYFSSIEGNIAFKEELLRADKDLEDAKHLRLIYKGKINDEEVERIKKEIREKRLKNEE